METNIVNEFQNLHVFSNSNIEKMDELVQDLTNALEESSKALKNPNGDNLRRHYRKHRGRKRRTYLRENGNMSEASESSLDEALKDYMENVAHHSDSDDLALAHHISRLTMPLSGNYVPSVESDSVTENFSPIRPQRRRKKYKNMAIDLEPSTSQTLTGLKPKYPNSRSKLKSKCLVPVCSPAIPVSSPLLEVTSDDMTQPGKRKRSHKSKGDSSSLLESGSGAATGDQQVKMDTESQSMDSSTSSISSTDTCDSDEIVYNEEAGREADDEQSDFFHESGPACGIPGVIPWWENERVTAEDMESERQFQQILNGSFEHLPKTSQSSFKSRLNKLIDRYGREIRFGRRKLNGKIPGYSVSKFIQERQKWNAMQGKLSSSWPSSSSADPKRRRKTPPSTPCGNEGFIGENADPIPESNIGNRMLQTMGWSPGMGLGTDGMGMKTPVVAYMRPKRQGLGCGFPNLRADDS